MQKKADYIIIGAGVLGSSLAYYLTKKGRDVIVLERGEICDGVSLARQPHWCFRVQRLRRYITS